MAGCASDRDAVNATNAPAPGTSITLPTPDPSTTPSTGATANGTGTGFDVLANMPDAAKEHTNAGAQAFARYYIEAYGRLLMDPAKGQLTNLCLPQCEHCQQEEASISDNLDRGVRWKGLFFRTVNVTEPTVNGDTVDAARVSQVDLTSLLTTEAVTVQEGNAPATTRAKGQDVMARFRLSWTDGRWHVADLKSQPATPTAR